MSRAEQMMINKKMSKHENEHIEISLGTNFHLNGEC